MDDIQDTSDFLFYEGEKGNIKVQVILGDETVWATQKSMADIFGTTRENITIHLKNVFETDELDENSVSKKILHTASDNKKYNIKFYNLDAIISVGYRVNSNNATKFRIWATSIVKEYLVKGFVLDDERLKQGTNYFGKDYFDELLERIKEIRSSERRFYQKITDIYSQCSIDYDRNSSITKDFYATVQNKLHYAITNHTAAEIIKGRANANHPNMGLTTWKNAPDGKILKTDVSVAKNYLNKDEINELNTLVSMYLDFAELQAKRQKAMKMIDWISKLDSFLQFNEYGILRNSGRVKKEVAKKLAEGEFSKFRVIQDKEYESDFDKVVKDIKMTGNVPKTTPKIPNFKKDSNLSDFNKSLKKSIEYNPKERK